MWNPSCMCSRNCIWYAATLSPKKVRTSPQPSLLWTSLHICRVSFTTFHLSYPPRFTFLALRSLLISLATPIGCTQTNNMIEVYRSKDPDKRGSTSRHATLAAGRSTAPNPPTPSAIGLDAITVCTLFVRRLRACTEYLFRN